jgi:S1-C subfamily serine protease
MREVRHPGEWSSFRGSQLVVAGLLVGLCLLSVGAGAVSLTAARADAPAPTLIRDDDTIVTEVGGAVVERRGDLTPAPIDGVTVVQVSVTVCGDRSAGTAVLVDDGLLLTAAHVVGDAGLVRIDHRGSVLTGEVLGVMADGRDLALIEIDASMLGPLRSGTVPEAGEAITVVGHPGGGPRTVVVGPRVGVVALARRLTVGDLIAVDASTPPGVSGGPALDVDGNLIGILVATEIATDTGIVVLVDAPSALADAPLVAGTCPAQA